MTVSEKVTPFKYVYMIYVYIAIFGISAKILGCDLGRFLGVKFLDSQAVSVF